MARDTKLGPEEITRDIPNVSEEALKNLDEAASSTSAPRSSRANILVGKITPKGESPMTPEEKRSAPSSREGPDVRDTSSRMPHGTYGTVVEVRVFNRHGVEKDERAMAIEREEIERLAKDRDDEQANPRPQRLRPPDRDCWMARPPSPGPRASRRARRSRRQKQEFPASQWWMFRRRGRASPGRARGSARPVRRVQEDAGSALHGQGREGASAAMSCPRRHEAVKVFVAPSSQDPAGDKMAGRHGNKGVVSRIVPVEDMPFPRTARMSTSCQPARRALAYERRPDPRDPPGWACAGMGRKIGDLLEAYHESRSTSSRCGRRSPGCSAPPTATRSRGLRRRVGGDARQADESRRVRSRTPVFDGAVESGHRRHAGEGGAQRLRQVTHLTTGARATPSTGR